jgi:hypothetical protein
MFWKYQFQRNKSPLIMIRAPIHKCLLLFVYIYHTNIVRIIIIIVICDTCLIGSTGKHLAQECILSCLVALFVFCCYGERSVERGMSDNKYGSWCKHYGILQLQHLVEETTWTSITSSYFLDYIDANEDENADFINSKNHEDVGRHALYPLLGGDIKAHYTNIEHVSDDKSNGERLLNRVAMKKICLCRKRCDSQCRWWAGI